MPHDNTGQELHVGDIVLVPARIKAIHQTEHYCNITLVTREVMPPTTEPTELTLNSHQVYRDPFNGGPPRASRDAGQPANDALQVIARGDIVLDGDQWYVMRPLKGIIPKHDGPFASWQEAYQYWLTHRVNGTPSTEVNKADREPAADPKDTINTVEAVSQTAQLGAGHAEAPREDALLTNWPVDESDERTEVVEAATELLCHAGEIGYESGEGHVFDLRDKKAVRGIMRYLTAVDSEGRDGPFGEKKQRLWSKIASALRRAARSSGETPR